ncbi:metal ABC transporter substrate-binding protein [Sulfitobacter albidus]|uniref:High-affinity zinc uptake system protein ZnuA n=1 Tax=Sulfitobacter albidus TaxID=2829501 RepID=A0A975JDK3_9RHOB|nr:zinc ABC transporter substrate-binding protein [Sulfitobacter albidus]QUJ76110.1 metal ABC transporter substrate-binding protein [Sulfitobacter albidus]
MRELSLVRVLQGVLAALMIVFSVNAALAQDRPRIVTVNQALHFLAERLLEDTAEVVFPVPEGVDPSFWRPSIADISMIQSADMILLNGAGFASWIDRVSLPRSRIVNTSAAIEDAFIVTESITHSHGDGGEHSHEGIASYTWLDPMLAIAQAEAIAAAVVARDLATGEDVEARLTELRSDLTELDAMAQDALSGLEGVTMIATHPRYQYFARRYSLSIASLEWDAGAMPSEDDLSDLERLSTELDARILIWEAQPPREAIELAETLGLQSVVFEPGASKGSPDGLFAAYRQAVSSLSEAASENAD